MADADRRELERSGYSMAWFMDHWRRGLADADPAELVAILELLDKHKPIQDLRNAEFKEQTNARYRTFFANMAPHMSDLLDGLTPEQFVDRLYDYSIGSKNRLIYQAPGRGYAHAFGHVTTDRAAADPLRHARLYCGSRMSIRGSIVAYRPSTRGVCPKCFPNGATMSGTYCYGSTFGPKDA